MRVSLYQMDCKWESPAENRHKAATWMLQEDADILVLPEMFTTGFSMAPEFIAETMDGHTVDWLSRAAKQTGKAVVTSVAICEKDTEAVDKYYNRMFFVYPDGHYVTYDKRHLFRMGGETEIYTAGKDRVVVEYLGWRILLQVCYDLRFPVFSRNRGDYDMAIYVASWPASRSHIWTTLLRARAIENQCYVVGVNRVGEDPMNSYSGDSMMIDFKGQVLTSMTPNTEQSIAETFSMEAKKEFCDKFPAYLDADNFTLDPIV